MFARRAAKRRWRNADSSFTRFSLRSPRRWGAPNRSDFIPSTAASNSSNIRPGGENSRDSHRRCRAPEGTRSTDQPTLAARKLSRTSVGSSLVSGRSAREESE